LLLSKAAQTGCDAHPASSAISTLVPSSEWSGRGYEWVGLHTYLFHTTAWCKWRVFIILLEGSNYLITRLVVKLNF
jgi:hypothetical protein